MTVFSFGQFALPAAFALAVAGAPAMAQTTGTSGVGAASQSSPGSAATASAAQNATAPKASSAGTGTSGVAAATKVKSARLPSDETFKTAAAATAHCPSDTVVWSTLSKSKSYHTASSKYYGKTKHGAYVCQKDATAAGFHAAKT